jgi:hypothetical protein
MHFSREIEIHLFRVQQRLACDAPYAITCAIVRRYQLTMGNRYEDKFDRYEAILDEGVLELMARFMGNSRA